MTTVFLFFSGSRNLTKYQSLVETNGCEKEDAKKLFYLCVAFTKYCCSEATVVIGMLTMSLAIDA